MPCRALEAFGRSLCQHRLRLAQLGLNALSGIGGVRTEQEAFGRVRRLGWRLNALSGIGGVRTKEVRNERILPFLRLNALSGIGGVRTLRRLPEVSIERKS